MANLEALPNELLTLICRDLNIPTLFNLRLAHPRLAAVIITDSISIAPSVAANTWTPYHTGEVFYRPFHRILRPRPHEQPDFEWLKKIPARLNAAVTVEKMLCNFDWTSRLGCTESEIRDKLEERVEDGWLIINTLGLICRRHSSWVGQLPIQRTMESKAGGGTISVEASRSASKRLNKDQGYIPAPFEAYLLTLPKRRLENYRIAMSLLQEFCFISWPKDLLYWKQSYHIRRLEVRGDSRIDLVLKENGGINWLWDPIDITTARDFTPLHKDTAYVKLEWENKPYGTHLILALARQRRTKPPQRPIWVIEPLSHEEKALTIATVHTGAYRLFLSWLDRLQWAPIASDSQVIDFMMTHWTERRAEYLGALKVIEKALRSKKVSGDSWIDIVSLKAQRGTLWRGWAKGLLWGQGWQRR